MSSTAAPDTTGFAPDNRAPEARYGLPSTIRFCRRCVISNQQPNSMPELGHTADSRKSVIAFDEDGVCDAKRISATISRNFSGVELVGQREMMLNFDFRQIDTYERVWRCNHGIAEGRPSTLNSRADDAGFTTTAKPRLPVGRD